MPSNCQGKTWYYRPWKKWTEHGGLWTLHEGHYTLLQYYFAPRDQTSNGKICKKLFLATTRNPLPSNAKQATAAGDEINTTVEKAIRVLVNILCFMLFLRFNSTLFLKLFIFSFTLILCKNQVIIIIYYIFQKWYTYIFLFILFALFELSKWTLYNL